MAAVQESGILGMKWGQKKDPTLANPSVQKKGLNRIRTVARMAKGSATIFRFTRSKEAKQAVVHYHKLHARLRDRMKRSGMAVPAYARFESTRGRLTGDRLVITEYGVQGMKWGTSKGELTTKRPLLASHALHQRVAKNIKTVKKEKAAKRKSEFFRKHPNAMFMRRPK